MSDKEIPETTDSQSPGVEEDEMAGANLVPHAYCMKHGYFPIELGGALPRCPACAGCNCADTVLHQEPKS